MSANTMILRKSWLDTRWRFIIGMLVMICSAMGLVLIYPQVVKLLPLASGIEVSGPLGEMVRKGIDQAATFDGYAWLKWYDGNLVMFGALLAALLGAGGLFTGGSTGSAFYTLALPVSRRKILGIRAAVGLAEFSATMLVSCFIVPVFAPAIGQTASYPDALAHGAFAAIAGAVFFSLCLFLATAFSDVWRPLLITLAIAGLIGLGEMYFHDQLSFGLIRTMSGEAYHETGAIPWLGLAFSVIVSGALIWAAILNLERRDF
jgi:ABC-2 type transport system permease protein